MPVETTVMRSTLASGAASARTTSGMVVISLSTDRRLVELLVGLGLHVHGAASASPFLKMISASASP